jgi:hypothetical protein
MNNADMERMLAIRRTIEPEPGEVVYRRDPAPAPFTITIEVDADKLDGEIRELLERGRAEPVLPCYFGNDWGLMPSGSLVG